jgi:hypothetical protein
VSSQGTPAPPQHHGRNRPIRLRSRARNAQSVLARANRDLGEAVRGISFLPSPSPLLHLPTLSFSHPLLSAQSALPQLFDKVGCRSPPSRPSSRPASTSTQEPEPGPARTEQQPTSVLGPGPAATWHPSCSSPWRRSGRSPRCRDIHQQSGPPSFELTKTQDSERDTDADRQTQIQTETRTDADTDKRRGGRQRQTPGFTCITRRLHRTEDRRP